MRQLGKNLALSLVSVVLTLALLELAIPLFVDVTDNIDYEHFPEAGLWLKPYQEGLYIRDPGADREPIKSRFHVNNVGFNNLRDYSKLRRFGTHRIAVVGDSFVEAFHVDVENAPGTVLDRTLQRPGLDVEVYTFQEVRSPSTSLGAQAIASVSVYPLPATLGRSDSGLGVVARGEHDTGRAVLGRGTSMVDRRGPTPRTRPRPC